MSQSELNLLLGLLGLLGEGRGEGTQLHSAAADGSQDLVKSLLESNVDPYAKDTQGCTALHLAVQNGHAEVVKLLMEHMETVSSKDGSGNSAMFYAVNCPDLRVLELFLGKHRHLYEDVGNGMSALQLAAIVGAEEAGRLLIQHGASVAAKDPYGWTALHRAAARGHEAIAQLLLNNGADIDAETEKLSTPLHLAAESGQEDMVQFLIGRGANIQAKDSQGHTPLHRNADSGYREVGLLLIAQGADVHARDNYSATPLHRAAGRGHKAMVQMLLNVGADVNAKAQEGWNPLHLAVLAGSRATIQVLLRAGADVNAPDTHGMTPLHHAAVKGNDEVLNELLENGADPYAEDYSKHGAFPIHHARSHANDKAIRLLDEAVALPLRLASRNTRKSDRELSISNQDRAHPDACINQLCDLCSKIKFSNLHEKDQCGPVGCQYHIGEGKDERPFNKHRLETHSLPYEHHSNLDALCASADNGCHLCSLIAFGLQNAYERLTLEGRGYRQSGLEAEYYGASQSERRIVLVYHKTTQLQSTEELEIFCGDLTTVLPVTDLPPSKCSDHRFSETAWDVGAGCLRPTKNDDTAPAWEVRFYARCLRPNHPSRGYKEWHEMDGAPLGGYPKIESYDPGQLVAVFAMRGKFWLAEFVYGTSTTARRSPHGTFGWVDSGDFVKLTRPIHPACACGKGVWEPPLLSMIDGGQSSYLAPDPSCNEVFSQINQWMTSCRENHAACGTGDVVPLPRRVVDVGEPDITGGYPEPLLCEDANHLGNYVTLSYRWWNGMTMTTTSSTLESRKKGIPLDSMPKTFQDAVTTTRKLGIRYLWIDALCIIQDLVQDWEEQSALMGEIYAGSSLNLSVSGATDFRKGFLHKRNNLEICGCRHPSLLTGSKRWNRNKAKIAKVICPNVPRHDRLYDRDPLRSRGWILQEHALSKRTLHFGLYEVYWECLCLSASEREPEKMENWSNASNFDSHSQKRRFSWIAIRSGVQYLLNRDAEDLLDILGPESSTPLCHDEPHDRWLLRNLSSTPKKRKGDFYQCSHYHDQQPDYANRNHTVGQFVAAHHLWYRLIEEYSLRFLTMLTDKLPAVSGLVPGFQKVFGDRSKYVAGIWTGDALNGLLWSPTSAGVPGMTKQPLTDALSVETTYIAPSFSWASFNGPVRFDVVQRNRLTGDDRYEAEVLNLEATPSGLNSLGGVSGGSVTLRAWAIPFYRIIKESRSHLSSSPFDRDGRPYDPPDEQVLCVSVRNISTGYLGEKPYILRQCLLVLPTEGGGKAYQRVGTWSVPVPEAPRPWIVGGEDMNARIAAALKIPDQDTIDDNKHPYDGWAKMEITIV